MTPDLVYAKVASGRQITTTQQEKVNEVSESNRAKEEFLKLWDDKERTHGTNNGTMFELFLSLSRIERRWLFEEKDKREGKDVDNVVPIESHIQHKNFLFLLREIDDAVDGVNSRTKDNRQDSPIVILIYPPKNRT